MKVDSHSKVLSNCRSLIKRGICLLASCFFLLSGSVSLALEQLPGDVSSNSGGTDIDVGLNVDFNISDSVGTQQNCSRLRASHSPLSLHAVIFCKARLNRRGSPKPQKQSRQGKNQISVINSVIHRVIINKQ